MLSKFFFILLIGFGVQTLAQEKYQYKTNLVNIEDDKVLVELITPKITLENVTFSFPAVIPGSYSKKDFGRFIDGFTALDSKGQKLKVDKINANQFQINNATLLNKITYKVEDTWDKPIENFVFQPGGSNIDVNKNFVINNHAFYGYFEEYKNLPIEIEIIKPATFYGATHLEINSLTTEKDFIKAKNYHYLADNPILYSLPDTTSFKVGKTNISVAVYSPNKKATSKQIVEFLKPMTLALGDFFNGLPIKDYQFIYFFEDPKVALIGKDKKGGYGALEHNYSSLYYLPESALENDLKSMVNEVSSHEFLHILTPLNLHSDEIENFDFIAPKMSQHLWLYEGVTEYFSKLVQVQNNLITEKQFFKDWRSKINEAKDFGNFSMTEMSKNVLDPEVQKKYGSVYNKGALIALALDLEIRQKTNNAKDLKTVIQTLAKKYGPNNPFADEGFFEEIVKNSHPDIKTFVENYIIGSKEIPYETYFDFLGYSYQSKGKINVYYAGDFGLKFNEIDKNFSFSSVKKNILNIKEGDVFLEINNIKITQDNLNDVWDNFFKLNTSTPQVSVTVLRNNKEIILKENLYKGYLEMVNYLQPKYTLPTNVSEFKAEYLNQSIKN